MHAGNGAAQGSTKKALARELLLAFGVLKCPVCGDEKPIDRLTKHHIHPRSLGGPTDLANLVLICRACHDDVHQFPSAFWARAALANFLNCRGDIRPFPPPPEPESPEEAMRYFFARNATRPEREQKTIERKRNPPFNPKWRIARVLPREGEPAMHLPPPGGAKA